MAELDIGQQCSIIECKQLDFLPFICDGCSRVFCLDHKGRTAHECSDVNYEKEDSKNLPNEKFGCTFDNCENSELVALSCTLCSRLFCLKHRNAEEHNCVNLDKNTDELTPLQRGINKIVENLQSKNLKMKKGGKKNEKLEAKVRLMKIKQKAVGDKSISDCKRTYFEIFVPSKNATSQMFVSEDWTIGRCVDFIAMKLNISNKNNNINERLLCLFNSHNGNFLAHNLEVKDLISENVVSSGSRLVLEYVDRT